MRALDPAVIPSRRNAGVVKRGEESPAGVRPITRSRAFRLTIFLLLIVLISCRREKEAESPVPPKTTTTARTATTATTSAPPLSPPANRSTPDRCAGDGSYSQAVDCYRQASRIEFVFEQSPGAKATGEMTRTTPGAEHLRFHLTTGGSSSGEWTADARATGVKWSQGGKPVTNEPPLADQLWQVTTMYIDPTKKEGQPQRIGTEPVGTESCFHYRFTDANSGAAHDVWVSTADGHIAKIQQESRGTFSGYSLTVKKMGK